MSRSPRADGPRRATRAGLALFPLALAAGCAKPEPVAALAAPAPAFDVADFFTGRTSGEGTLDVVFKDPVPVRVEGLGRMLVDGTLVLDQIVARGEKPPERREWRIREIAPGRWRGYLSDATDLVEMQTDGNQLRIRYPMSEGLWATQYLYLQPDGRTALNRMTITKLGVKVGALEETIRKVD